MPLTQDWDPRKCAFVFSQEEGREPFHALAHFIAVALKKGTPKISGESLTLLHDAHIRIMNSIRSQPWDREKFSTWIKTLSVHEIGPQLGPLLASMYEDMKEDDDAAGAVHSSGADSKLASDKSDGVDRKHSKDTPAVGADDKSAGDIPRDVPNPPSPKYAKFAKLVNRFGVKLRTFGPASLHATGEVGGDLDKIYSESELNRKMTAFNDSKFDAEKDILDNYLIGNMSYLIKHKINQFKGYEAAPYLKLWFTDKNNHAAVEAFEYPLGSEAREARQDRKYLREHNAYILKQAREQGRPIQLAAETRTERSARHHAENEHASAEGSKKSGLLSRLFGGDPSSNDSNASSLGWVGKIVKLVEKLMPSIMEFFKMIGQAFGMFQSTLQKWNPKKTFTAKDRENYKGALFGDYVEHVKDEATKQRLTNEWLSATADHTREKAMNALKDELALHAPQSLEALNFNLALESLSPSERNEFKDRWKQAGDDKQATGNRKEVWNALFVRMEAFSKCAEMHEFLRERELYTRNIEFVRLNYLPEAGEAGINEPMEEVRSVYSEALKDIHRYPVTQDWPEALQKQNFHIRYQMMKAIQDTNNDPRWVLALNQMDQAKVECQKHVKELTEKLTKLVRDSGGRVLQPIPSLGRDEKESNELMNLKKQQEECGKFQEEIRKIKGRYRKFVAGIQEKTLKPLAVTLKEKLQNLHGNYKETFKNIDDHIREGARARARSEGIAKQLQRERERDEALARRMYNAQRSFSSAHSRSHSRSHSSASSEMASSYLNQGKGSDTGLDRKRAGDRLRIDEDEAQVKGLERDFANINNRIQALIDKHGSEALSQVNGDMKGSVESASIAVAPGAEALNEARGQYFALMDAKRRCEDNLRIVQQRVVEKQLKAKARSPAGSSPGSSPGFSPSFDRARSAAKSASGAAGTVPRPRDPSTPKLERAERA